MGILSMRTRSLVVQVLLVLVFGLGLTTAHAQYRGSVQGTVTDAQGAVVQGATVTLTDKETNRTLTAETNSAGVYNIGALPPSRYTLTVEKMGFKKQVLEDAGILSEQSNAVNVVLSVGEVAETMTVTGDSAPLLDTETASLGGTVTSQEAQTLPVYGRDVFQLLQLAPGAFADGSQSAGGGTNGLPSRNGPGGPGAATGIFSTQSTPAVSVGGGRQEVSNIQIDGVGATDAAWGGTTIMTPNLDSVKEVKVVTNGYDAEDGRYSAGQIKVITQNGTNQYHGSAHWRADRAGFNAYQKYNGPPSLGGVARNNTRLNDLGGSLGGPIFHDKLFGFFSYETIRTNGAASNSGWFETPEFRAAAAANSGSAAALILGYKGAAPLPGTVIEGASDGNDCANLLLIEGVNCKFIPGQGLDIGRPLTSSLGTNDQSFVPVSPCGLPSTPPMPSDPPPCQPGLGGDGSGNASNFDGVADIQFLKQNYTAPLIEQQFQGRVDFNPSNRDLLAFSFFFVPITNTEFRANAGGWRQNSLQDNKNAPWGLPIVQLGNLAGVASIGSLGQPNTFGIGTPFEFNQWAYAGKDVLTKVYHSHTLKMGGEVTRLLFLDAAPWNARPTYNFNNMWDLLNDAPNQESATFDPKTGSPSDFRFDSRETLYGFFLQDSYKVKPGLTVTAGLRWEYFGPISEKHGHLPTVELGQGVDAITGLKIRTGGNLFNSQKNNFGPQLGFAWTPGRFSDLVLRGGFGIGFNALQEANSLDGRNNPPYLSSFLNLQGSQVLYGTSAFPSSPNSLSGYAGNPNAIINFDPSTNLPVPGQNYAPVNLVAYQPNMPTTRTYRYSLDLQYDLGKEWVATLGYQGTASRHLTRLYNYDLYEYARLSAAGQGANAFNPVVQSLTMYDNEGRGNFNALLAGLRHRFGHSFELETQYRWSKGLDTGSNNYSPAQHNGACSCGGGSYQYTMNQEYGPSDFDVAHTFKLFGIWSPTIFHGEKGYLEKIAGGWTLSGILNLHTGFPWTPQDPNLGFDAIYQGSGSAYGGGSPLRPGYYLGGFHTGNFKTQNYPSGALALFPENNPTTTQPCYVAGPSFADIIAGIATPGPIPCAPAIGRNVFRGPGYFDIDATLGKSFGLPKMRILGENAKFAFTANFYNLFNKVNLTNVQTDVTNPYFGVALGALGSRTIDFQARISF